ncbi:MAG: hypothetical protein R2777_04140 [Chitinophagales bacterium]
MFDEDIADMKSKTDALEANNPLEAAESVTVSNDLQITIDKTMHYLDKRQSVSDCKEEIKY